MPALVHSSVETADLIRTWAVATILALGSSAALAQTKPDDTGLGLDLTDEGQKKDQEKEKEKATTPATSSSPPSTSTTSTPSTTGTATAADTPKSTEPLF